MHAVVPAEATEELAPLARLLERRERWARASFAEQAKALQASLAATAEVAAEWVERGHAAKGLPPDHAEEWLTGPVALLRALRLCAASLRRLDGGRSPVDRDQCRVGDDGRVYVRTFPTDAFDAVMFRGFSAEQRMAEGLDVDAVIERAGAHARARRGGLALVLGAGNVSSIPPLDALTLAVNAQVPALVKLSPVNAWVRPCLERGLAPLIEMGAMAFVEGDAELGGRLVHHPEVTEVHLTGSAQTYDRIVWGTDEHKRQGRRALDKPVSAELGSVSPVAIVPGTYTDAELDFCAAQVVAMVTHNASFNCTSTKVLVLADGWHQKEAFIRRVEAGLRRVPTRRAYYPGAHDRYAALTEDRPSAERIGRTDGDRLPWTLVRGLDPSSTDERLFAVEPFCSVLSIVELDVPDALVFVDEAVEFVNERLWGTLTAAWFVSESQRRLAPVRQAIEGSIGSLRYGVVGVNQWPALAFAWASPAWGGHPSSTPEDVQSGLGWVHNTYLLEGIEQTVVRGPMPVFPKPVWFADHHHAQDVGRKMVGMEARPSWLKVPSLVFSALLG